MKIQIKVEVQAAPLTPLTVFGCVQAIFTTDGLGRARPR